LETEHGVSRVGAVALARDGNSLARVVAGDAALELFPSGMLAH
jgi:hypothetical protein